ncbi:MAG TPA: FemAB family XrtA/PEP-CTERM system-associated protein [Gemmatimonadaceae bacterium]|nr:FemAB family XrtA/PEP-CTERM system-associated protein [Gemmatimonadaceae bacterium]
MTIRVEIFGAEEEWDDSTGSEQEWDEFAATQNGFTHFHRLRWRTVIEKVFGHRCAYLAARDPAGKLIGILPLVHVRSVLFGNYLVSMPFVNYGGPLGSEAAIRALLAESVALARMHRVKLLELRSSIPIDTPLEASHRKITVMLDLPSTSEKLFKQFEPKLRSQIRRPQKEGITVRFGRDHLEPFFSVFARNMRDLGTPTQSLVFFREIANQFPEDFWIGCAYLAGRPVAGACGFRFANQFEMTWASSLREYNRIAPNMLVYWAFMERAIADGASVFNFGRCTPGAGTHRFKMQWGGSEHPLWWYGYAASNGVTTPSPHDARFSWGPRIWRRLPAPLATKLGPSIVRYIP